ncbi:MAG: hypothetical protein ACLTXI_06080 [Collinsella sp.]
MPRPHAAPEMLTQDIEGIAALRRSPAIDVYALSSILYQLYSGRKPFDVESTGAAATGSFCLIKTKTGRRRSSRDAVTTRRSSKSS